MIYRVRLAASGHQCVDAQLAWYRSDEKHGGEPLAKRWFDALHLALAGLSSRPTSHGLAPENEQCLPEFQIRQMLFRPWKSRVGWRVLYTIDERKKMVTVLQVRHERRRRMFEAEDEE